MKDKCRVEVMFEVRNGRTLSRRKEYYEDGTLSSEGLFSNGGHWGWDIPAGTIKKYFKSGALKSEEHYDDGGNKDGESRFYNETGILISKISYAKDKKILEEHFDKTGRPLKAA